MPFEDNTFYKATLRAKFRCEMCGRDMSGWISRDPSALFHIHSATSLHLVRSERRRDWCMVTDPPTGHSILRGRLLPIKLFKVFETFADRDDDGFCLCVKCHSSIHNLALWHTKLSLPYYMGRSAAPAILENTTLYCINIGLPDAL